MVAVTSYKYADMRGYTRFAVGIANGHNQKATVTVQHAMDPSFLIVFPNQSPGNPFSVPAATTPGDPSDPNTVPGVEYEVMTNPMPFTRLQVAFATAPTKGSLSAWLFKQK